MIGEVLAMMRLVYERMVESKLTPKSNGFDSDKIAIFFEAQKSKTPITSRYSSPSP